ncbi:hypothetical protein [Neptuniibacter sp. CAU 1671]|uniref:hypothetical protein n=1 Tax=Neptuniibacter sp. CAU 1671 TaxID=3032593 RepID=UPI0023DBBF63|nr:hypothetical protein [Neptuniibacter sp. CAU 1671]MDF2182270.1 hypothetical protein [Neptuniibacter sp. CAU 1671]
MKRSYGSAVLMLLITITLTACSDDTDKVSQENKGHLLENQQQALEKAKTVQDTLNRAYDTQQNQLNQATTN